MKVFSSLLLASLAAANVVPREASTTEAVTAPIEIETTGTPSVTIDISIPTELESATPSVTIDITVPVETTTAAPEGHNLLVDGKCIVTANDGPKQFALAVSEDCADAVLFAYDDWSAELKSVNVGTDRCLSAVKQEDGSYLPKLDKCKVNDSRLWKSVGDNFVNELTCECLGVNADDELVFVACDDAPTCEFDGADMPEAEEPDCKAPATTTAVAVHPTATVVPPPADSCGNMPACPPSCTCQNNKCVTYYQCFADNQCAYGQVCSQGWCVYPKPQCVYDKDCPAGYVCDPTCHQCVIPKPVCPPGYEQEGYWCVPIKPECGWKHNRCPPGYHCEHGFCKPDQCFKDSDCWRGYVCKKGQCVYERPTFECRRDSDCAIDEACEGKMCVKVTCAPGCMGQCVHGQCVGQPQCRRDNDCKINEACEGGKCVLVQCAPGCLGQCIHGQCVGQPQCRSDNDCKVTEACEGGRCVVVNCLPGCLADCIHGVCVPKCRSNNDCALNEACEGGICVLVQCNVAGCVDCRHGVCFDAPKCTSNNNCDVSEKCDLLTGKCNAAPCLPSCAECVHGECKATLCLTDSQCKDTEVCDKSVSLCAPQTCPIGCAAGCIHGVCQDPQDTCALPCPQGTSCVGTECVPN